MYALVIFDMPSSPGRSKELSNRFCKIQSGCRGIEKVNETCFSIHLFHEHGQKTLQNNLSLLQEFGASCQIHYSMEETKFTPYK